MFEAVFGARCLVFVSLFFFFCFSMLLRVFAAF